MCDVAWDLQTFDNTKVGVPQTVSARIVVLPAGAVANPEVMPTLTVTVVEGPTIQVTALSSEMLVKKGATGKTLSVTATATAGDGTTNLTSNLKYQWKVSDTVNGTFVNVANGTSSNFIIPTDTIGVKYYACELTVKDPKTDTEAKRMTDAIKVEVCGAYRVRLATDGDTNKPITVGTKRSATTS